MSFLLDTNIISETVRPKPEPRVLAWLEDQSPEELFLSSQTIGELVRGACKVKEKARRDRFTNWIEDDLSQQFDARILPFTERTARIWGELMGNGDRKGETPFGSRCTNRSCCNGTRSCTCDSQYHRL